MSTHKCFWYWKIQGCYLFKNLLFTTLSPLSIMKYPIILTLKCPPNISGFYIKYQAITNILLVLAFHVEYQNYHRHQYLASIQLPSYHHHPFVAPIFCNLDFLFVLFPAFHVDLKNNYQRRQYLASMLLPSDPDDGR